MQFQFDNEKVEVMRAEIEAGFRLARVKWPSLALDLEAFARFVTPKLSSAPKAWGDLALVDAALRGVPGAIELLEREVRTQVQSVLRANGETITDDVTQELLERLVVGPEPRLHQYSGRGTLTGWLRAAAVREVLNRRRGVGERAVVSGEGAQRELERVEHPAPSVDLQVLQARYGQPFNDAFRKALRGLTDEQRDLLRLHVIEKVSLLELSRRWSVHRTTLASQLQLALDDLARATHEVLNERITLTRNEFESLSGVLQEHLQVSLTGLENE